MYMAAAAAIKCFPNAAVSPAGARIRANAGQAPTIFWVYSVAGPPPSTPYPQWQAMILDLEGLNRLPTRSEPYQHLVMLDFIKREHQAQVLADFPAIPDAGLYTPDEVPVQGHFAKTMDEVMGSAFEAAMSRAFGLDLSKYPKVYTLRGHTRAKDGSIHTDSRTKVVTVLLYFNANPWPQAAGRLRILRSATDLADYSEEVPPAGGMLLAFKRSDRSWHGHPPFEGPRRAIQLNWVTSDWVVKKDELRHRLSARIKALKRRVA